METILTRVPYIFQICSKYVGLRQSKIGDISSSPSPARDPSPSNRLWKSGGITTQEWRAILRDMLHLEQVAEQPTTAEPQE